MRPRSADWFSHIMGINESEWDYTLPPGLDYGEFNTVSIRDLKQLANIPPELSPQPSVPPLYVSVRRSFKHNELFDTSALQLGTPHSMFQVASNFNCLELGSVLSNEFSGRYLTGLMTDTTQGPSAAAGAGLGAIKRLALHHHCNINLLQDVPLLAPKGKLYEASPHKFDPDLIKIGLHTDVRATFDRSSKDCVYHPDGPLIDQVFVSTVIMGASKPSKSRNAHLCLAQTLLKQAYVGTYLAAAHRKNPRLVLTLIGGGAFKNPPQLIVDAIVHAHTTIGPSMDCRIELPIFEPNSEFVKLLQRIPWVQVTIV